MTVTRDDLLARLAALLASRHVAHTLRVAVDGPDAAGKTSLADELAGAVRALGRPVLRVSVDGFHRPAEERRRRGSLSAEGYFLDAFDYDAVRALVLHPLGRNGDGRYRSALSDLRAPGAGPAPVRRAPVDAVLLRSSRRRSARR